MADERDIEGSSLDAIIADEIRTSLAYDQSELASKRANAIAYMRGEMPDLKPRPNGSTQTSHDVADTISKVLPGVVRIFTAASKMVSYERVRDEDDRWASEATEYMNHSFFVENDGYHVLLNATNDSLLLGNGLACSYWDAPEIENKTFRDLSELELAVKGEEGWEPVAAQPGKPQMVEDMDPVTGNLVALELPTYTVKMQRTISPGRIVDKTGKPENLIINTAATSIDDARFVGYLHDDKSRSDLMEMADAYGWDTSLIEQIPSYNMMGQTEVAIARTGDREQNTSSPVASGDPIDLYEIYMRVDIDGDGIAEMIQVWYAGGRGDGTVLGWDEWEDEVPFTDIPCYPVPHRWDAEGLFDRLVDIQRVKTTLLRQALDNIYAVNMPMREVEQGSVLNPDILVNSKFGGLIWKKAGSNPIIPHVIPFTADKAFAAMEYMDKVRIERTGVSSASAALDPEALQNQTATASQLQHDVNYSQTEFIARNQAELGWKKFFRKRLKLAIKHEQVRSIPSDEGDEIRGEDGSVEASEFRTVSPPKWDANMKVSINVGLGTGSRDRDMSMLNVILNGQIGMADRLGMAGMQSKALEFLPRIRMTAVKLAESSGLKNPEEYYPEITDEELAQMKAAAEAPKVDPAIELENVKGANAKALKEVDAQVDMQTAELQAQNAVLKNQAELEADMETANAERQSKLQLESIKQQSENQRFFAKLAQDRELALLQMGMAERESSEKDEDGKPVKKPVDATSAMLMDGLQRLGEMVGGLSASMSAPTEIVRGPDGRAVGTRKVVN